MSDLRSYVTTASDGLPTIVVRSDKEYIAALEAEVERLGRLLDDVRRALDASYSPQMGRCKCDLHPADVFDRVVG